MVDIGVIFYFYLCTLNLLAFAGLLAFFSLAKKEKMKKLSILLTSALVLVCFYEDLAFYTGRIRHLRNHWVINIFFFHFATWLHLFIISEFVFNPPFKKIITGFAMILLIFSGIPYALGLIPLNQFSNYTAILAVSLIIISCGFFFFDLLSNEVYLPINPIRFSGFWISTTLLFFYAANFMIFISLSYLIENHLEILSLVRYLPMILALPLYLSFLLTLLKWKGFKNYNLNP